MRCEWGGRIRGAPGRCVVPALSRREGVMGSTVAQPGQGGFGVVRLVGPGLRVDRGS